MNYRTAYTMSSAVSRDGNTTPRPTDRMYQKSGLRNLHTPEPTSTSPEDPQIPDAPIQPPPRFLLRRRRNAPLANQLRQHLQQDEQTLPSIELSTPRHLDLSQLERPVTPVDTRLLSPVVGTRQLFSPPKTPLAQIRTSFDNHTSDSRSWTPVQQLDASFIDRPSSAMSDSSASSASSSETSPSYGGSCTSPESDTADPFNYPDYLTKRSSLGAPVELQASSKPRKRIRTSNPVKWTPEMDDHLWMTYLAYQTNPEVTPFKALPGVSPPLGVCHRVAREAKRSWTGPRLALRPISEGSSQSLASIDSILRESSAPPEVQKRPISPLVPRPAPMARSHSSIDHPKRTTGQWPRSEASTRRRLRELAKSKPNLPAHYQRLMQTRSPSPFGSSSSTIRRSSRLSPSPAEHTSSSFATDDLKLSLTAHTMSSMQPGNALWQLASERPTAMPSQYYNTWSSSSSRSGHQKSQSLPYGPTANRHTLGSRNIAPLASPFHAPDEDPFVSHARPSPHTSSVLPTSPPMNNTNEPPWQIHAPRPMSGSMKRRADFDLGEDLISPTTESNRSSLQDLFPTHGSLPYDVNKRARVRGFSMGAMRHSGSSSSQPRSSSKQLAELFDNPPEVARATTSDNPPVPSIGNLVGLGRSAAPPSSYRPPRLASPFAPLAHANGLSNTFPRSLFPHGLDSIANMEHRRPHSRLQALGSNGTDEPEDAPPSTIQRRS